MITNEGPGSGQNPQTAERETPGFGSDAKQIRDQAGSTLADVSGAVKNEARELGAQAQRIAGERAEEAKDAAVSHLDVFADALRAASDELGKNQSGPAAEMISNAASGLEGLTRSLHGQSTGQMVDTVRRFGRENPLAFLAGSVLAGLALGRFASVASTDNSPTTGQSSSSYSRPAPATFSHGVQEENR